MNENVCVRGIARGQFHLLQVRVHDIFVCNPKVPVRPNIHTDKQTFVQSRREESRIYIALVTIYSSILCSHDSICMMSVPSSFCTFMSCYYDRNRCGCFLTACCTYCNTKGRARLGYDDNIQDTTISAKIWSGTLNLQCP